MMDRITLSRIRRFGGAVRRARVLAVLLGATVLLSVLGCQDAEEVEVGAPTGALTQDAASPSPPASASPATASATPTSTATPTPGQSLLEGTPVDPVQDTPTPAPAYTPTAAATPLSTETPSPGQQTFYWNGVLIPLPPGVIIGPPPVSDPPAPGGPSWSILRGASYVRFNKVEILEVNIAPEDQADFQPTLDALYQALGVTPSAGD